MASNKNNNNRDNYLPKRRLSIRGEKDNEESGSDESDLIGSTGKSLARDRSEEEIDEVIEEPDEDVQAEESSNKGRKISKKAPAKKQKPKKKPPAGKKAAAYAKKKSLAADEGEGQSKESNPGGRAKKRSTTNDDNERPKKKQKVTPVEVEEEGNVSEEFAMTSGSKRRLRGKRNAGQPAEPQTKHRRVGDNLVEVTEWPRLKREDDDLSRRENVANATQYFFSNGVWHNTIFNPDPQSTRGTFAPILLYVHLLFHGLYKGSVLKEFTCSAAEFGREILDVVECSGVPQKIHKHTGMSPDTVNKAMKTLENLKLIRRVKKVVSILLPPPIPNLEDDQRENESETEVSKERLKELMSIVKLMKMENSVIIKGLNNK